MHTEEAPWWCPTCEQARKTTFSFARKRSATGKRLIESATCDRGHTFNPYD